MTIVPINLSVDVAGSDSFRGFNYAMNVANPTTHIDIPPGACQDALDQYTIETTVTMAKRINANWAAGDGNGFLDTGTVATGPAMYYVHGIYSPATLASDFLCSTSLSAPVMPTGWTGRRLLGAFAYSSGIVPFIQAGEWHWYKNRAQSINNAANTTTPTLRQLLVPTGAKCEVDAYLEAHAASGAGWVIVQDPDLGSYTATSLYANWFYPSGVYTVQRVRLQTDNLGRVSTADTNTSGGSITLHVNGFCLDRSIYR